jgi:hypothetical protein
VKLSYKIRGDSFLQNLIKMKSKIVGLLKEDEDGLGWVSKPFEIPYFDNLKLQILFIEAEEEAYLNAGDSALRHFMQLTAKNRIEHSALLYPYYEAVLSYNYIQPFDLKTPEDIWKFVQPSEIIVDCDENDVWYVCVTCECDWEEEHGLQLVFTNGEKLTRVGGHDGHYTD